MTNTEKYRVTVSVFFGIDMMPISRDLWSVVVHW